MSENGNGKELVIGGGFTLQPKTMDEAIQFAKLMSDSDLVPKDYKGKPGNILIAVQMGAELDIPPMQAIQNIAVINGRPGIFGDLGKAVLLSKGCKIEELTTDEMKKQEKAVCVITRPDGRRAEYTFTVEDAKKARLWGKQGPWTEYPYRQLGWRAFWFCARNVCADMLKGMGGAEELRDFPNAVETTAVAMPKPLTEKPNGAAPAASAVKPTPADASEPEIITETAEVAEAKRFSTHCEVTDSEGVTYLASEELARLANDNKGKIARFTFTPAAEGKRPTLVSLEITEPVAA